MPIPRTVARGGRGQWLLDIDFGGYVVHVATQRVDVTARNGRVVRYVGGLSIGDVSRTATSAALTVAPTAINWQRLFARGLDPTTGVARLRRWFPGQVLEAAPVRMVGPLDDVEWGEANEPLTATLSVEPWRDQASIPGPSMQITESTWPVQVYAWLDELVIGKPYPIIIGAPGNAGFASETQGNWAYIRTGGVVASAPAYMAEYNGRLYSRVLVAGHPVQATEVVLHDASDGVSEVLPITQVADDLGQIVSVVDFTAATIVAPVRGHTYYTAWRAQPDGTGYGGLTRTDGSGRLLRGAGEVLVWLYTQGLRQLGGNRSTALPAIRFDRGRQEAQRAYLDRFKLDACIAAATTIDAWVRSQLQPILPIEWVQGEGGGYWLAWRWDAVETDAVAVLSVDAGRVQRVSRPRTGRVDAYTRFVLDYGRVGDGDYVARAVLCGEADSSNATERSSGRCLTAQRREATRTGGDGIREWAASSDVVSDVDTAHRVLEVQAARNAIPPIPAQYSGGPELEALEIGDVVVLEDSAIGWSRRVALIADITPGDTVTLDLFVLADTARVLRTAA